jgi:hypothetical protein
MCGTPPNEALEYVINRGNKSYTTCAAFIKTSINRYIASLFKTSSRFNHDCYLCLLEQIKKFGAAIARDCLKLSSDDRRLFDFDRAMNGH